jgi:two-component system sensor histidine kinase YesM
MRKVESVNSKIFIRNLRKYLIPLLVPIVILGSLSIIITEMYAKDKAVTDSRNMLEQIQSRMGILVKSVDPLNINFALNSNVIVNLKHILNSTDLSYDDKDRLEMFESMLGAQAYSQPYIDSIFLYFKNDGKNYISSSDGLISISKSIDTGWYNSFLEHFKDDTWCETRAVKHYSFEQDPTQYLTVYKNIKSFGSSGSDGVIVVNIKMDYIRNYLDDLHPYKGQIFALLDHNNHVVCESTHENSTGIDYNQLPKTNATYFQKMVGHDIVTEINGGQYGFRYVSVTPFTQLYEAPIEIMILTFFLLIISFLIGLAITYIITQNNCAHIKSIIEIIDSAETGSKLPELPNNINDEYAYITYNIIQTFIKQSFLKVQLSEKKYKMKVYELLALQTQINPHFLFNTLETISLEAIRFTGGNNEINRMIENLSTLLQSSLGDPDEKISLYEEVKNARSYIEIQKVRYHNQFEVKWDYAMDLRKFKVIKLILQPFIENSISYGLKGKTTCGGIKIKVKIKESESFIHIAVIDNGIGISSERLIQIEDTLKSETNSFEHIGLYNTNKRIKLTYGDDYGIRILSKFGLGTSVHITIPKIPSDIPSQYIS